MARLADQIGRAVAVLDVGRDHCDASRQTNRPFPYRMFGNDSDQADDARVADPGTSQN